LSKGKRGTKLQVSTAALVSGILYRLKTGCQGRELPLKEIFGTSSISWQACTTIFGSGPEMVVLSRCG